MKGLKKEVRRLVSLLVAAALVVVSAPQEYLTVRAAEIWEDNETQESALQETGVPETEGADPVEKETETGRSDSAIAEAAETESATETKTETESESSDETETQASQEFPDGSETESVIETETVGEDASEALTTAEQTTEETQINPTEGDTEATTEEEIVLQEETRKVAHEGKGDNGNNPNVTWTLYTNGDLEVIGEGEIISSYDQVPWSNYTSDIKTAKIAVTGATRAQYMFHYCYNLKSVDLSGFPTDEVTDMSHMFENCGLLESLDVSMFNTSKVTDMSYMFYDCKQLKNLDVSKFDTSQVINMSVMFRGCEMLTNLDVSSFNTSQVTTMSNMFWGCKQLKSLDVSQFDTAKVKIMSYMFRDCLQLTDLDVSRFDTGLVTEMHDMFENCASLTRLDLSSFVIKKDTYVSSMLFGCNSLKEIVNPYGIDSDTSIYLPKSDSDTGSWRWPDGEKTDVLCRLLKEEDGKVILSRNKKFGISFQGVQGAQFKLADERYKDKTFNFSTLQPEEVEIVDRGAEGAKTFTFTLVPDEGYLIKSVEPGAGDQSGISVTKGELPDQYIVTPLDPNEGYTRDEIINVTVVPFAEYELDIYLPYSDRFDEIIVANGDTRTDGKTGSVQVSNRYDTTVYVKCKEEKESVYLPKMYYRYNFDTEIRCDQNIDSMSAEEKEYVQKGYSIFRLGRIETSTYIEIDAATAYRLKFTAVDFPGEVHVYRCTTGEQSKAEGSSEPAVQFKEYPVGEEVIQESGQFYIRVQWADTPEGANKWCRPQVTFQYGDKKDEYPQQPTTLDGVDGDVWKIDLYESKEVIIELKPHTIELTDLDFSSILDFSLDNPYAQFYTKEEPGYDYPYTTVWKDCIDVYGGDSLALRFRLDDGLRPDWSTDSCLTYTQGEDGAYTIAVKDMSKLWEISSINLKTYDPQNRQPLSGMNLTPSSALRFKDVPSGQNPVYTGDAIVPTALRSLTGTDEMHGKPRKVKLAENKDYTWTCENNVNAGEALIIVKAVPSSKLYRGEAVIPFTIEKAAAPDSQEKTHQIEMIAGQSVYQVDLSEVFQIDHLNEKGLKPSEYKILQCDKGEVLAQDADPVLEGGMLTYTLRSDASKNSAPAKITFDAAYTNYNSCGLTLNIQVVKKEVIELGGSVAAADKVYDGKEILPDISGLKVISKEGTALDEQAAAELLGKVKDTISYHYVGVEGTQYDSERSPVDIGTYQVQARVADENLEYKSGYLTGGTFRITQRPVTITADDVMLYLYDTIPAQYSCRVDGLAEGDTVSSNAFITCEAIRDTDVLGEYPIVVNAAAAKIADPTGRDVTANYSVTGQNGRLEVCNPPLGSCIVTYKWSDPLHLEKDIKRSGNEAGMLLEKPDDPAADGYIFLGWFTDEATTKEWNFAADIIQGDLTLYAGWSKKASEGKGPALCVQEIAPQTYTGAAIKPAVIVYAADGKTQLKLKTDYTITYKNNTNADAEESAGGIGESINDTSGGFNSRLPYVVITGKGNYQGTVYANFHINPADISGAEEPGSGFALKYTDQFDEKPGKYAAVVTQLKYKKKNLKYGVDYTLTVKKTGGAGSETSAVPLNAKGQLPLAAGTYQLTIEGKGNYKGAANEKTIYVADKTVLLKNAKVTGISAVTNVTKQKLADGITPDDFPGLEVKLNNNTLIKGTDYEVECIDNHAVGTAAVIISAKEGSSYSGSRRVAFQIKGEAFKANAVQMTGWQDTMPYTGKAVTQNGVALRTTDGRDLIYGEDYTISYQNNIKKGAAKVIFTAKPSSGYSGKFNKSFKITPMDLKAALESGAIQISGAEKKDSGWKLLESVPYQKGGTTAADKISMQLVSTGTFMSVGNGKDYTVAYKNNKEVSNGTAYMTLKGSGNFAGTVDIYFDIRTASLAELREAGRVTITSASIKVGYPYSRHYEDYGDGEGEWVDDELKDPDREFKPAITIKDGKTVLKKDVDFTVEYSGNTRSELEGNDALTATITGIGNYGGGSAIELSVAVNRRTLSAAKVEVEYENEFVYTGGQIIPSIGEVRYKTFNGRGNENSEDYEPPEWDTLSAGEDYRVEYLKNVNKGTGTIKIIGIGSYTGSLSKTFKITSKPIYRKTADAEESE